MQSLFQQRRIAVLSVAFFFGWMLAASDAAWPSVRNPMAPAFASAETLWPGSWMELEVSADGENAASSFGLAAAAGRWEQRFERVNDALEMRVGGMKGSLITFEGKGEGKRYTWTQKDGAGTQDLTPWVGTSTQIKLWARVWMRGKGQQRASCAMDTLYNGYRRQRWEFSNVAEYTIKAR